MLILSFSKKMYPISGILLKGVLNLKLLNNSSDSCIFYNSFVFAIAYCTF